MNRLLYSLAWWLALPLVLMRLWWRGRREPGYRAHLAERCGFFAPRLRLAPMLWVHAVSVGETRAAEPLIAQLLAAYPDHDVLLTHMTPSGRATGAALFAHYGARIQQAYLPYDTGWMMQRLLKHFSPQICVLMETELWPNLMACCAARRLPVALVNARLSARSLKKAQRFGHLIINAARQLTAVGAQTRSDASRISALGVTGVTVTGSIKFDVLPPAQAWQDGNRLRQQIGARPVLLFASTRDGEEALILDALAASNLPPNTLLLIVPRHPQRFDAVAALCSMRDLQVQRRSQIGDTRVDAHVLLGDTMGEMFAYCVASDLVAIGGSLLPLGGQNPLEACAVGKAVLLGPHTFNFAVISEDAIAAGAGLRVDDATALLRDAGALLRDPALLGAMGVSAAHFAQQHRGATARTMDLLQPLINRS